MAGLIWPKGVHSEYRLKFHPEVYQVSSILSVRVCVCVYVIFVFVSVLLLGGGVVFCGHVSFQEFEGKICFRLGSRQS